jgi:hypothetical protein
MGMVVNLDGEGGRPQGLCRNLAAVDPATAFEASRAETVVPERLELEQPKQLVHAHAEMIRSTAIHSSCAGFHVT